MNRYVLSGLEFGPVVVERIIGQLDPKKLDTRSAEGRFTPREVAAHLADWEPILMGRIQQSVEQPGSVLATYDDDKSNERKYSESNVTEQLAAFAQRRKATVAYLKNLQRDEWEKSAVHPERGAMTVLEWAAAIMGHDMYHIEQLTAVW